MIRRSCKHLGRGLPFLLLPALISGLWQVTGARPLATWKVPREDHLHAFTPDGKAVLTTRYGYPGVILVEGRLTPLRPVWIRGPTRVWDVATGRQRFAIAESETGFARLAVSPDSRLLAVVTDWRLRLWEVATGEERPEEWIDGKARDCTDARFSPEGHSLVLQEGPADPGGGNSLHFWDVEAKRVRVSMEGTLGGPTFGPDGTRFAVVRTRGPTDRCRVLGVELWDLGEGTKPVTLVKRHRVDADRVVVSPTLKTFATGTGANAAHGCPEVWVGDLSTGLVLARKQVGKPGHAIHSLSFSPDGRFLFASSETPPVGGVAVADTPTSILDVEQGLKTVREIGPASPVPVFAPNGRWLLSPNGAGSDLLETNGFRYRATLHRPGDCEARFFELPDGLRRASGSFTADSRAVVMTGLGREPARNPMRFWRKRPPELAGVGEFADEPLIARLWAIEPTEELAEFDGCADARFSPDGKLLAARYNDGVIRIWDVPPRKPLGFILGLAASLWAVIVGGLWLVRRLTVCHKEVNRVRAAPPLARLSREARATLGPLK
jgi:WD40 repeat protein